MSEPQVQFELPGEPEPTRRSFGGWIALATILTLLCANSLFSYFNRDQASDQKYVQVSSSYRMWVLQNEVFHRIPLVKRFASDKMQDSLGSSLDDLIAQVVEGRKTSGNAARLYVSMRHEKGVEIKPEDLKTLEDSKEPYNRQFARIYAAKDLEREKADELIKAFPEEGFSFVMARIHALEKAGDRGARRRILPDSEIIQPTIALGLFAGAYMVGVLLLLGYFAVRIAGRARPMGHPVGRLDSARADSFAGTAALLLFAYIAVSIVAQLVLRELLPDNLAALVGGLLTLVATFLILTRLRRPGGPKLSILGYERANLGKDVLWGIGGFFVGVPLFMTCVCFGQFLFSGLPPPDHPIMSELQANQSIAMLLLILGLASVIAPIFEEICFRGVMTPATDSLFGGPFMGIVASSLAFSMIHPQGITGWLPLAMIGATAAMLVYQRKSLVPAIVYHAVHNCFVLTMSVLML